MPTWRLHGAGEVRQEMSKQAFTTARLAALHCPIDKTQVLFWDAKTPGLGLRVTKNGSRAFVFESRLHGKTVRITIGATETWDLGQARAEATRLKVMTDQGRDPRAEKQAQTEAHQVAERSARRQEVKFGEAWDVYVERRRPHWSDRHYEDHLAHGSVGGTPKKRGKGLTQAGPLAVLRKEPLIRLDGVRVEAWLTQEAKARPTVTALSYRLLRGFIRWAAETDDYKNLIPSDSYRARAVKDAVPRTKAKHGDVLQREQLAAWFQGVNALSSRMVSTYLQCLLITGARREELAALRWEDVDLKWSTIVLDDKVEGTGGRTIPLTAHMRRLLLEIKALNETPPSARRLQRLVQAGRPYLGPSPWVFASSTSGKGRITEPRSGHQRALTVAGLPHLTIHGLRRSFGTLAEWCEVPVGIVAQIQGHKPSAIAEKHYRRRPIDMLRLWHQKIEDWLLSEAGISRPSSS